MLRKQLIRVKSLISKLQKVFLFGLFMLVVSANSTSHDKDLKMLLSRGEILLNMTSRVELEKIDKKIEQAFDPNASDFLKARYYNFKGTLASRQNRHDEAVEHFKKGLEYAKKTSITSLELSLCIGFVVHYQANDLHDKALNYLNRMLELINQEPDIKEKRNALAVIANFYRSIGNERLEKQYIDQCVLENKDFASCQLLDGNFKVRTGNFSSGLKILWTILLKDPEIRQMNTVFAIQTIIYNYISVSHFQKAEELTELLLQKTQDIGLSMTSNFIALKADLYREKGEYDLAKKEYSKAFEMYDGVQFRSEVLKNLFVVNYQSSTPDIDFQPYLDSRTKSNDLLDFEYSYDFVDSMNKIVSSNSTTEFTSYIERLSKFLEQNKNFSNRCLNRIKIISSEITTAEENADTDNANEGDNGTE